jgi:uncharacterized membrane protein YoaK (UPF0700 family)
VRVATGRTLGAEGRALVLAVLLTIASGGLDAISFTRLGSVFSSVVTGNLVLLGLSVGERDGTLAAYAAIAVGAFVVGGLAGSRLVGSVPDDGPVWPPRVGVALGVELVPLAVFLVGWLACGGRPSGGGRLGLLALVAVALGVQSGAVSAVRIAGLSTTYLTGTLVGVLAHLSSTRDVQWPSVGLLVSLVAGAAGAGLLVVHAADWAPVLPVSLVAVVLAATLFGEPHRAPQEVVSEGGRVRGHPTGRGA